MAQQEVFKETLSKINEQYKVTSKRFQSKKSLYPKSKAPAPAVTRKKRSITQYESKVPLKQIISNP